MFKYFDFKATFIGIVVLGIAFVFIAYNLFFAVNFPFQDDFLLLQFVEGITKSNVGFDQFISALFSTQNDHKAVIPRLIALANYEITGSLNYKFYILLTNLIIGFIYYFFYKEFKKLKLNLYYFIPVGLFLFQPLYYEISSWALSGMQQTYTTVFTILALNSISKNSTKGMFLAIIFCFLATFTHGNGIFSFPAIICYLFFLSEWKKMGITFALMIIAFLLYMSNYESGQAAGLPSDVLIPIVSFFGFVGSSLSVFTDDVVYSVIFGGVIFTFVVFLVFQRIQVLLKPKATAELGNAKLLSIMVYIIVMSLVIAIVRTSVGGGISSRFQLYASMSLVIFYLLLIEKGFLRKSIIMYLVVSISVFYTIYSYYRYTGTIAEKKVIYKGDIFNWKYNRTMFSVEKTIVNNASFYLLPAYERGMFATNATIVNPEELKRAFSDIGKENVSTGTSIEDWVITRRSKDNDKVSYLNYFILYNNDNPINNNLFSEVYLVLKSRASGKLFLHVAMPKLEARKVILTQGKYYKGGFKAIFRNDDLENGVYDLMLLRIKMDGTKSYFNISEKLNVIDEKLTLLHPNK